MFSFKMQIPRSHIYFSCSGLECPGIGLLKQASQVTWYKSYLDYNIRETDLDDFLEFGEMSWCQ